MESLFHVSGYLKLLKTPYFKNIFKIVGCHILMICYPTPI